MSRLQYPDAGPSIDGLRRDGVYTAVIDIGSGSARAVVMRVNTGGSVEIVAQQRVTLNLMSHLDGGGFLDATGIANTVGALEDFALVARGYGIKTIHAVATAALRESGNARVITDAASDKFGIPLRIIEGAEEAAYCFLGAVHGLPVGRGLMADIGGGSAEIVSFADRTLQTAATLPLGSLRIANRFRLTDRPAPSDVSAAYEYVGGVLSDAAIPALSGAGVLAGSGGSVRLLARLARSMEPYPVTRMHGYEIDAEALAALSQRLVESSCAQRAVMPGMNPERSPSIVGGAIVADALMRHAGAAGILISGQGLREGLARNPGTLAAREQIRLPSVKSVRMAALTDLAQRFAPRYSWRGQRRAGLAGRIAAAAWDGRHRQLTESLQCAALLLDIGNAVDFYNRLNLAASIITSTDLPGFTHREAAQIAAILLVAERKKLPARFRKSRLLTGGDRRRIRQASAILQVADAVDRRLPPEYPADSIIVNPGSVDSGSVNPGEDGRDGCRLSIRTPAWSPAADAEAAGLWNRAFDAPIDIAAIDIGRGEL